MDEAQAEKPIKTDGESSQDNFLFNSIDKVYTEERERYEKNNAETKNRALLEKTRAIVNAANQDSSDNISMKRGAHKDQDTITITPAFLEYGDLIEVGENAVTKKTDWIQYKQRKIAGQNVNVSIRLISHDFTKMADDGPVIRLGPVVLEGKATDSDGVTSEIIFAHVGVYEDRARLLYNFGSDIVPGTEDYNEVEEMVSCIEKTVTD